MKNILHAFLCVAVVLLLPIAVFGQVPVANFTASPTTGCTPIVVQFTDASTGNPTSWSWNLGNGTTSTQQNPSTTYTIAGTYTVTLTATNSNGSNTKTVVSYINAVQSPTVNFTGSDTTFTCAPKTVVFTNQTIPNSSGTTTYYWDFGDGTSSNAANPTHIYTTAGSFSVTLVATNGTGCTKAFSKNAYILVAGKPTAAFSASNNNSCTAPLTTSFTNNTAGVNTYQWLFGDGGTSTATSPTHTYNTVGSYTVTLIVTNAGGCKDTLTQNALVNIGNLTAGFTSNSTTCTNNPVSFTNTTVPGGGGSTWYFGDGGTSTQVNPIHAYAATGTYTVKLVVNYNNCADSVIHTITVNAGPSAQFTGTPLVACAAPLTTSFTNNTTGAVSYLWLFGDGGTSTSPNPSYTYNANGSYTVKLIATSANGCTDTLTRTSYVNIQPASVSIAQSAYGGCAPVGITFSATATSLVPVSGYTWSFGDGGTGSGATASHTYTTSGVFTVSVTVTTTTGCTTTNSTLVYIGIHPTSAFTAAPTTVCTNTPVQFTNNSLLATGGYTWLFGDGGTAFTSNPAHSYGAPGVYSVTLISTNNGCTDTLVIPNYITVLNPLADFNLAYTCNARKTVTFTNASVGATSYSWNFGDGSPASTAVSPVHTYASYGNYAIILTATSSITGCTSSKLLSINLFNITPTFTASDTLICKGTSVNFNIGALAGYANVAIDFGDGSAQVAAYNLTTASHIYTSNGSYTVKVVVTDLIGCKDSMVRPNYIKVHAPTAAFTNNVSSGCLPLTVTFTDNSTATAGLAVTSHTWSFGDGGTLTTTATTVTHTYITAGSFTVALAATETGGCIDNLVKPLLINITKPVASFSSPDTASCLNTVTHFTSTSTGAGTITYNWTFGDGGTSILASPTHSYSATGVYTVRLIVTDANGCKDTLTKNNYINVSTVHSSFTMSDSTAFCPPFSVSFTSTSTGAASYLWIFGNGNTSALANTTTTFIAPGTYTVKLIATNANGCRDTSMHNIVISSGPTGTFTYNPTNGCSPLSITFNTTSANTSSLTFDFDNGITQTTTSNTITYTYTTPGIFIPKVILSTGGGCSTFLQGTDTIKVDKAVAGFSAAPTPTCIGTAVQFTDTSHAIAGSIATRNWAFGDGGTSVAVSPAHTYGSAGTYTVRLIVTTANGCLDTTFRTVVINPLPVITGANQTICGSATVQLSVSGAATYNWSPATGLSCTNCANPIANPPTTTTYTITGTSAAGCVGTGTLTVTVNPVPVVSAGANQSICNGGSVSLNATGAATYVWSPATGLSCTACANPTATPASTTIYTVTGTSALGCTGTSSVTVNVGTTPTVTVTASQAICAGSSAVLTANGANTYSWTPTTGLSCSNCSNPLASPVATTTYTVTGTALNGCTGTATTTLTINPLPTVSAGANTAICSGASTTLTATGASTYSWSPAGTLSCANCASPVATPAATTIYTVTGTAVNGCTNTAQVTVTVNPLPTVNAGTDVAVCNGASTTLTATGASTYSWSPAAGLSCTSCASTTASPASTTAYIVTGTASSGCTRSDTVIVTVNTLPVVSAGNNQSICPSGSTILTATGAAAYVWSPATGLSCTACASTIASPSATITYTVTGTSAAGCVGSGTITVSVNNSPTITVTGNTAFCAGGNTPLTAGGATTYTWSPATGLSCTSCANPVASPAATTTYTVTGTSGVGCSGTTNVTITVNPNPTVSAGSNTAICAGGSTILTGTGAATYTWSPATGLSCTLCTSTTASPASTTVYTVTGATAAGCTGTSNVTVTVNALPVVSAGNNTAVCPGGTAQLQATGAATYVWTPATGLSCTACSNPVATPAATTTYTVTGTGANGCTASSTVTVAVNTLPVISIAGNTSICQSSSTALTATGANSFSWSPATGLSCSNCASPTASPAATATYTVTGTSGVGCTGTATITITVHTPPTVSAGAAASICAGISAQLQASGATSYVWTPATGLSCTNCASPIANPAATTTYTVTGTDAFGCTGTSTVTVTVKPVPVINAGPDASICGGNNTQLNATGGISYVWTPATGLSCTTCANPVAAPTVNTTYSVTGTGANGCTATDAVNVSIYAKPAINAGPDQTICNGQSAQLLASGGSAYVWSPATALSCSACSNPLATPSATITYGVIGTDVNGCKDSDRVQVTVIPKLPVSVSPDGEICEGETYQLTATGGTTYAWSPAASLSNPTISDPIASPIVTTIYQVLIKQGQCFADSVKVKVTVHPKPTVNAGPDQNIFAGSNVQLITTGANIGTYVWSPAEGLSCTTCSSPVASPDKTTTYTVSVSNQWGCTASDDITIAVRCDGNQVWLPNTFTPNGDGENDRFYPHGRGLQQVNRFRVFDRWGELIFERTGMPLNDKSYGWDGTYKGQVLKPDVYVWILDATCTTGDPVQSKGDISLVR